MLQFDFREDGSYRFAHHVPGPATVVVAGSHSLIDPPSKIVFSWIIEPPDEHAGIESEVSVEVMSVDSGSELGHPPRETRAHRCNRAGWCCAIDQLTLLLSQEDQCGR